MSQFAEQLREACVVVFDFDGTLVDSTPIKHRAFEACFAEFVDQREEILNYCWGHHHTPRSEKFRHVYEQLLGLSYTPEVAERLHQQFEEATTQQIIEAAEIPGAEQCLALMRQTHVTAILSSTPQVVLRHILMGRNWLRYVHLVQGAPVKKAHWLTHLRLAWGGHASAVVFFGDTPEDGHAAREAGCTFVHVGEGEDVPRPVLHIPDFTPLVLSAVRSPHHASVH